MCVCVQYVYYSISHDSAYLSRQEAVVIINGSVNLLAAVQVQFQPQNYTVTEGGVVNVTLVTSTSNYEFDFNVTLQYMNGSATGESCSVTCTSLSVLGTLHNYVPSHPIPCL